MASRAEVRDGHAAYTSPPRRPLLVSQSLRRTAAIRQEAS